MAHYLMNILIVRLSSIGDIIHTLPAVPLLKKKFPNSTITWVVEEPGVDLLRGYPGVDHVIVAKKRQVLEALRAGLPVQAARLLKELIRDLRQGFYDIILDFQGLFKSGILVLASRGRRKIGFGNAREGATLFYTERAPAPAFHDHALQRHMALLKPLGITDAPVLFSPLFRKEDAENLEMLLENEQVNREQPVVCLHPCARWETKLWGLEKTARLCDMLYCETGCQVLLVGSSDEKTCLEHIAGLAGGHAKNMAGKTSLRELAALLSRAALMVSTDSGPLHFACAAGTPVVGLFGPTAPWRTGPFGQDYTVVRKELACSPCFKRRRCPEGHRRCMNDIMVEDVFKVCCNYLKSVKREA